MPHSSHHEGPDEYIGRFRLEMLIAILLGIAALVGAAGAYFGHVAEGHSISSFNEGISQANVDFNQGIRDSTDSNLFYSQGNQKFVEYRLIFQEFAKDAYQGLKTNDETVATYIQKTLMDPALQKMVAWWETGSNTTKYSSPFVDQDPYYGNSIPDYAQGQKLDQQATSEFKSAKDSQEASFSSARKDEHQSNSYTLVEVLIASSLFLYGIASVTKGSVQIKLGFLGAGFVLFALSVIQLGRARWG